MKSLSESGKKCFKNKFFLSNVNPFHNIFLEPKRRADEQKKSFYEAKMNIVITC